MAHVRVAGRPVSSTLCELRVSALHACALQVRTPATWAEPACACCVSLPNAALSERCRLNTGWTSVVVFSTLRRRRRTDQIERPATH